MKISRVLLSGLLILLLTAALAADEASQAPVRFAIFGDRTGSPQKGIYGQIVEEINRLRPDFAMTVGDMIVGYTDDPELLNSRWNEYDSIIEPLTIPVYFTPGNNDIYNEVMEDIYRRRIGEPYNSFDYQGLHFIILDNSRWDHIGPCQYSLFDSSRK